MSNSPMLCTLNTESAHVVRNRWAALEPTRTDQILSSVSTLRTVQEQHSDLYRVHHVVKSAVGTATVSACLAV